MSVVNDHQGIWEGLASAIADTLQETSGAVMTKVAKGAAGLDISLDVANTYDFPVGVHFKFVLMGYVHWATKITNVQSQLYPTAGVQRMTVWHRDAKGTDKDFTVSDNSKVTEKITGGIHPSIYRVNVGTPVVLYRTGSGHMSDLRDSFFVDHATGESLNILGKNYGIERPANVTELKYRQLLRAMIYLDATTMYSLKKVLDALLSEGKYELYEDLINHPNKVFVYIGGHVITKNFEGRTYMSQQSQLSTGGGPSFTLSATGGKNPVVYGIYASTDKDFTGTNYALATGQIVSRTAGTDYVSITASSPHLDPADTGKSFLIGGTAERWELLEMVDGVTWQVGKPIQQGGSVSTLDPLGFTSSLPYFEPWMKGHKIQIVQSDNPANCQILEISEVVSATQVKVSTPSPAFTTESDMLWRVKPNPTKSTTTDNSADWTASTFTISFHQLTASGTDNRTITATMNLPSVVTVHYVNPQLPTANVNSDATIYLGPLPGIPATNNLFEGSRHNFYLFDNTATVQAVCDLITAAGVKPVILSEEA